MCWTGCLHPSGRVPHRPDHLHEYGHHHHGRRQECEHSRRVSLVSGTNCVSQPPVLKAAPGFPSSGTLFSGQDPSTGVSGELSFTVALKNIVLDTTNVAASAPFVALWWGVAQGAHLQNVKIHMPWSVNGAGHSGIRLGRGSTLSVSDVRIEGGQVRIPTG